MRLGHVGENIALVIDPSVAAGAGLVAPGSRAVIAANNGHVLASTI